MRTRGSIRNSLAAVVLLVGMFAPLRAQDGAPTLERRAKAGSGAVPAAAGGDLRGLRDGLERHGFEPSFSVVDDWSTDIEGGARPGSTFNRALFDVSLEMDMKKMIGWKGATALVRLHSYQGDDGGDYVGDAQGFSNIDDTPRTLLYELWVEQKIPDRNLRVRVGKIDANSIFATVENGANFLNSSMGYSPTILRLPTYPEPRASVNAIYDNGRTSGAAGLFASDGSGLLWLAEGAHRFSLADDAQIRVDLGAWQLRGRLDCYDGTSHATTEGWYMVQELTLPIHTRKSRGDQKVGAFFQYGYANTATSEFGNHMGGGVVWSSPFGRGGDSAGVGLSVVSFSEYPDADHDYEFEGALEVFYGFRISKYLNVIPDFQWIRHPGGIASQRDAVVFTPRLKLSF